MPYATYRFNKIIAAETIRFIVTVAIVVYKGLKLVVYRMLTIRNEVLLKSEIYYEFIKDRYEISLEILLILKIKPSILC